jgi:hypothetical protein
VTAQQPLGTKPLGKLPSDRNRRVTVVTLLVGILIGILLSVLGTIVLFNVGFFDRFYVCPAPVSVEACPPEDLLAPVCPTCPAPATEVAKSIDLTPSPTVTATPNLGATATAACGEFEAQFPGTPCPEFTP